LIATIKPFVHPIVDVFAEAEPSTIRQFRRQVGNAGQRQASFAMMEAINTAKPSFNPPGLAEYVASQDQTGTNAARQLMPELQLKIRHAAMRVLRTAYGADETGWWRKGVPEKVRTEVAARREVSPEGGSYEQFFELLDYRAIAADHWDLFSPFFAFGEGRSKDSLLNWFSRLNGIRNRVAHPERGAVSDEELEFIESVLAHFDDIESSLPVN
jgi:hypothetical protein